MKIFIYILKCPVTGHVRYVGSSKNPKVRFSQHLKDARKDRTKKQKWILWLASKNEMPIIQIVASTIDELDALKLEEETLIQYINTVYNIHMPDKNHGYVEHFRQTGIKERKHGKCKEPKTAG